MTARLLYLVNDAAYFLSHRLALAQAARDAGWDVHVATAPSPPQQQIRDAGFPAHDLPLSRSGLRPDRELRALFATCRLLRRLKPDLVHCVALKATVTGGLAARIGSVPARVFAIAGLGHVFTEKDWKSRGLGLMFEALFPLLVSDRSRVIVQNRDDLQRIAMNDRLRGRVILIAGSGVDLDRYRPSAEPDGPVTILLASRMIWKKGIGDYVEAAKRLASQGLGIRFLMAGASDLGNPASISERQLAAWNRDGPVQWLGQRSDMPALLSACQVFCLPSYYGEGIPKCLIEAAAAGRPIVTTDMPGCRDIVRHDENGLLVAPRDIEGLAAAIRRVAADPALRRRYGKRGREMACADFGLSGVIDQTMAVYRDLAP